MKLAVIGTGYVGLVTGVCWAQAGHSVVCVDRDRAKIERLKRLDPPLHEQGLPEMLAEQVSAGRLSFTFESSEAVSRADIAAIAVGTPSGPDGQADISSVLDAAEQIAGAVRRHTIVMIKSTVPVGTGDLIADRIRERTSVPCDVVSVPEFLREGSAIHDTLHADRIVIGLGSDCADAQRSRLVTTLEQLFSRFTDTIIFTQRRSAELIKYASNAFLATKISFINEIANLCEKVGADVADVANGMGADRRIGSAFLRAGIGYGGSCFPKDIQALLYQATGNGCELHIVSQAEHVNKAQPLRLIGKLTETLGRLEGRTVAVWGLSYKPGTDDVRDSAAHIVIRELLSLGAQVRAYDPVAVEAMKASMGLTPVHWCMGPADAAAGSHAVVLLTEWDEFAGFDLSYLPKVMKLPVLIDGRNVFTREQAESAGLIYQSIGRPASETGGFV